jgi:hypothetical protein
VPESGGEVAAVAGSARTAKMIVVRTKRIEVSFLFPALFQFHSAASTSACSRVMPLCFIISSTRSSWVT